MRAVITGASSGIGIEFARLLAINGYDLIISARRADRLNALRTVLQKKYGVSVEVFTADLSEVSEVKRLSEYCFSRKTDVLINNAGFGTLGSFHNVSDTDTANLINTNISALTLLTKAFINTQEDGYILNVASVAAFMPGPFLASYYASKAYVLSFSAAVNEELKQSDKNISITTLCPGPMKTEFFKNAGASKEFATSTPRNCAKRGLNAMFGRRNLVFSDTLISLAALSTRFAPLSVLAKISGTVQRNKFLD